VVRSSIPTDNFFDYRAASLICYFTSWGLKPDMPAAMSGSSSSAAGMSGLSPQLLLSTPKLICYFVLPKYSSPSQENWRSEHTGPRKNRLRRAGGEPLALRWAICYQSRTPAPIPPHPIHRPGQRSQTHTPPPLPYSLFLFPSPYHTLPAS